MSAAMKKIPKSEGTNDSDESSWTVELTETVIEHPRGDQDVTVDQGDG